MLPNFLCIGAQKSGTTSMWHLLNAHPDIFMSAIRETRFFFDDILYQEGLVKYELLHFGNWQGQKMVGEKCPEYLCTPGVAERISKGLGPHTKFIVCLRDPAQRAFSQYRHNLAMFRESRSFEEALADDAAKTARNQSVLPGYGYIVRGNYGSQIRDYFNFFDNDRFLFTSFENETISDQKDLAKRVYQFLGVHPFSPKGIPFSAGKPRLEGMTIKYHKIKNILEINRPLKKRGFMDYLTRKRDITTTILDPSEQLITFANQFNSQVPIQTHLPDGAAKQINRTYFKKEIMLLQQLINIDCSNWLD